MSVCGSFDVWPHRPVYGEVFVYTHLPIADLWRMYDVELGSLLSRWTMVACGL